MKILIIKLRYIGDTILITPLLTALKAGIHNAQLDVLVHEETRAALGDNRSVRVLWGFDYRKSKKNPWYILKLIGSLRREHYDMVIELTNNDRGAFLAYSTGAPLRIG